MHPIGDPPLIGVREVQADRGLPAAAHIKGEAGETATCSTRARSKRVVEERPGG
ncbi:hypothetical protein [Methanofollis aquaemaris]|uniref:hypothetical protein n=1 Tax=Methanofollis aquaemaris TaxID=126734 RepID=UPI00223FA955|nr:hypothetical protein [Methanofollis aquaemaris]